MDDLKVKVVYRNKELNPTSEQVYCIQDYTDMLRLDLMRIVTDVEDLVYMANGNKNKDEWSDDTWTLFQKIRHKLLDKAGAIGRLPNDIVRDETWQDRNG